MIGALADRQHGVVARWQLLARGISRNAIARRIRDGRLRPVHRGIYLVGHRAMAPFAMEAAAVLACGAGAVISHRSAARLHAILAYPANGDVWVTTTAGDHSARPRLVVRTTEALDPRDVSSIDRIPITTPARTLLDLAGILGSDDDRLERACAEAHALGLAREPQLRDQIARSAGRRGVERLRTLLDRAQPPARTRSDLERLLLRLIRASALPEPEANVWVGPYMVDFLWREQRVIVETDGLAFHSHERSQRRDRGRTNALQLRGYIVLRFTWADVTRRGQWVHDEIRAALNRPR